MDEVLDQAIQLLRLHQQRASFVDSAYASPLSLVEAYLLIEIDIDPAVAVKGLCNILALDKSVISRALERLERDEYVARGWSRTDKRERRVELTKKGQEFLELHDAHSRRFLAEYLARLSITEIAELQTFQHMIGDAAGAPNVKLRTVEHPFEEGIRRVTRGLGFIGPSLFGSGYSSTVWQILSEVKNTETSQNLSSLAELLGFVPSSLSQLISKYQAHKWVTRKQSKLDKRVRNLSLTATGVEVLEKINSAGRDLLKRAFKTSENAQRFVSILRKHLGAEALGKSYILREQLEVSQIETDTELQEARGFLVFHVTRLRRYMDVPEVIVGATNTTLVLREATNLRAVCEIKRSGDKPSVVNFAYSDSCSPELIVPFLHSVTKFLKDRDGTVSLSIKKSWVPPGAIGNFQTTQTDDDYLSIHFYNEKQSMRAA